jgi:hypothetical protein
MKYSILFLLLLLTGFAFGQPVYSRPAQNKCSAENISLYGVKIGMTQNEVESLFNIKLVPEVKTDDEDTKKFAITNIPETTKSFSLKTDIFLIQFYNDKVYNIFVLFDRDSIDFPKDLKKLTSDLTSKWRLSENSWSFVTESSAKLDCDEIEISVSGDLLTAKNTKVNKEFNEKQWSLIIDKEAIQQNKALEISPTPVRERYVSPTTSPTPFLQKIISPNNNLPNKNTDLLPEKCSVKFSELPLIRGLQLGMSKTNVLANYPKCRNEIGTTCYYRAEDISSFSFRNGLDAISIAFDLDTDKVSSFSLVYDTSLKWKSSKEFAESISDNLKFEPNNWTAVTQKKPSPFGVMKYSCTNYYATVSFIDNYPNLSIVKSPELIKVEKSKKKDDFDKEQERKKKEFKP